MCTLNIKLRDRNGCMWDYFLSGILKFPLVAWGSNCLDSKHCKWCLLIKWGNMWESNAFQHFFHRTRLRGHRIIVFSFSIRPMMYKFRVQAMHDITFHCYLRGGREKSKMQMTVLGLDLSRSLSLDCSHGWLPWFVVFHPVCPPAIYKKSTQMNFPDAHIKEITWPHIQ